LDRLKMLPFMLTSICYWILFILIICVRSSALVPSTINLGGIFNIYDANGVADTKAMQHMSAFLLAIDQINKRTDILPNTTINYVIRNAYDLAGADIAVDIMSDQGVPAVISSLSSSESYNINVVANANEVVTLNSGRSSEISSTKDFQYSFQTSPLESYQGKLFQRLLCDSSDRNYSRVIVYASGDVDNFQIIDSLQNGEKCFVQIVNVYTFPSLVASSSFTTAINRGIEDQVTTVYVMMPEDMAAAFISEAYRHGLLRLGVSLICSSNLLTDSFISKLGNPDHELKGMFIVDDFPYFNIRTTQQGNKFLNSFINQSSTLATCGSVVDVTGYRYLYRNGSAASGPCIGLDYSSYQVDPSLISFEIAYTYDSVYAWAYAADSLLKQGASVIGSNLAPALIDLSFRGATGGINYSPGIFNPDYHFLFNRHGDRAGGFSFLLYQYHSASNSLNPVSVINADRGVIGCFDLPELTCSDFEFNTADNTPPDGYPPYTQSTLPDILRVAGMFSIYDENLARQEQIECLAAFVMAIKEVNNKADGIFDDLLPLTQIKFQVVLGSDYPLLISTANKFYKYQFSYGVRGLVSAINSGISSSINEFFTNLKFFQVNSKSTNVKEGIVKHL
jgi:ABC-type branched-subunit amino acid transport system substrate-binding protein